MCLSMLLSIPAITTFTSLASLTTVTTLTSSAMASNANFCPVEGSDYFDKPEGNIVKVTHNLS